MTPKIISLGEVLWDLFPQGEQFGGAPANFACHASIHGADVSLISAVGDDQRATQALNILDGYGIDTSLVQTIPSVATGTVGVAIDSAGQPTFSIHEDAAWDRISWESTLESQLKAADAVYFGTLSQRSEVSRDTVRRCLLVAKEAGVPRIVDINLRAPFYDDKRIRDSIKMASILKLSDEELPHVLTACGMHVSEPREGGIRQLLDAYDLDLLIMTQGADGAVLVTADEFIQQPGIPTDVRDTVGAGDSFTAAFLVGWLRGEALAKTLRHACMTAAAVCAHAGAVPPI